MTFMENGMLWAVRFVEKESDNLKKEGTARHGICNYDTNTIYIMDNLSMERKRATLAHELTHAIMETYGFYSFDIFNHEQLCEFVSAHGSRIIARVDAIMLQTEDTIEI